MIQSAEEFITEIADDRTGILTDKIERGRSRDKAIVERCKEKMREVLGFDPDETEADELLALDSVLRELSE